MVQKKQSSKTKKTIKKNNIKANVIGLVTSILAIITFFNLGIVGIVLADCLRLGIGDSYRLILLAVIGVSAYVVFYGKMPKIKTHYILGMTLFYVSVLLFFTIFFVNGQAVNSNLYADIFKIFGEDLKTHTTDSFLGGGVIGGVLFKSLSFLIGNVGVNIIAVILLIVSLLVFFMVNPKEIADFAVSVFKKIKLATKNFMQEFHSETDVKKPADESQSIKQIEEEPETKRNEGKEVAATNNQEFKIKTAPSTTVNPKQDKGLEVPLDLNVGSSEQDYKLPGIDLLTDIPPIDQSSEMKIIKSNKQKLEQTLKSFGVNAKVIGASLGPSVTKYEVQPAVGVKVSKIVNLADDLALAMSAKDIRIEAPIPGKPYIGIEVPNRDVATVSFKEVFSNSITNSNKVLEVPLGKDVSGNVVMADLTSMPHLLIAGSTGSGKSVAVNGIITSIIMKAKPSEVKLMLIDPKMVELNVYNGIAHLITPVVTDPRKATSALNNIVKEMENRYKLFSDFGIRNINEYNLKVEQHNAINDTKMEKMPYIVVIVDELSDLMMVASNEIENAIIRITQMARAAGIHLIIATQRPSVDVITGLIKANVPSRMAFAVSSGIDSRTIIDGNGAEKLLGKGDMLFKPQDANKPTRIQGAFIPTEDVERVVEFSKQQKPAEYVKEMEPELTTADNNGEDFDPLYGEAIDFVIDHGSASTSLLQRKFRIGYNRAARMIDDLQENHIIGPADGSRPRKVLVTANPINIEGDNNG